MGNRDNQPLSPRRAAELMRDVEVDEIPSLVEELNRRYDETGAPYQIVGEGDGYRLTLRREFHAVRNRFYGRVREARLVAGGHRRAGVGGLSAADDGREDSSPARQAEQPRPGPSGASRPVADRAARRQASHAALLHDRAFSAAVQSANRSTTCRGAKSPSRRKVGPACRVGTSGAGRHREIPARRAGPTSAGVLHRTHRFLPHRWGFGIFRSCFPVSGSGNGSSSDSLLFWRRGVAKLHLFQLILSQLFAVQGVVMQPKPHQTTRRDAAPEER